MRTTNKNNKRGLLQPFTPLLINWRGKSDLVTLTTIEMSGGIFSLSRQFLIIGFYINELLYYLLNKYTGLVMEELFCQYEAILNYINIIDSDTDNTILEIKLREFELCLLDQIGYGLQFEGINSSNNYNYDLENGFYIRHKNINNINKGTKEQVFSGQILLNIQEGKWSEPGTILSAKHLLRRIIQFHIGNKELNSRKLYKIED